MQPNRTSKEARRLLERLKAHPELRKRFESILERAESEEGAVQTADEVEALLIEQVRRLGAEAMEDWARGAQVRIEGEFKKQDPSSYRGKRRLKWRCVFGAVEVEEWIWRNARTTYQRFLRRAMRCASGVVRGGLSGR